MATRKEIDRLPAAVRLDLLAEALEPESEIQLHFEPEDRHTKQMKSNNPYALYGESQERGRANAPPRAVFHDLSTAHSSITSGSARSRAASHADDPFHLQKLDSANGRQQRGLPRPQPVAVPKRRVTDSLDLFEKDTASLHSSPSLPVLPPQTSVFTSIKNAVKSITNNSATSSVYNTNFGGDARPSTHGYVNGIEYSKEVMHFESFPSTPVLPQRTSTPTNDSTVGIIYKHYVRGNSKQREPKLPVLKDTARDYFIGQSSNGHQYSSPLDKSDPLQPSALNIRKQHRLERSLSKGHLPPRFALPQDPVVAKQPAPISSQNPDARNLLQIPQQAKNTDHKPSICRSDARSNLTAPTSARPADPRRFSSNNPYKINPQVVVSHHPGDEELGYRNTNKHVPLEREVSKALRRASNYSVYSNVSFDTTPLHYEDYHGDITISDGGTVSMRKRQQIPVPSQSESSSAGLNERTQGFYDHGAIPSQWFRGDHQNGIRIPINRTGHFPASPPITPYHSNDSPFEDSFAVEENSPDVNDWETVDDTRSYMGLGKRCGSSCADNSEFDDDSVPVFNGYRSMDRIARHPAEMGTAPFRQRTLKDSRYPVLLPVFAAHKVNGYPSDSSRFPAASSNHPPRTPQVIEPNHRHPFRTPPEVMKSPNSRMPNDMATSINTFTTINPSTPHRPAPLERSGRTSSWMRNFGEPGPSLVSPPRHILRPSPIKFEDRDEINSWQHIVMFANGETVPGYNADGTRIKDPNSPDSTTPLKVEVSDHQTDGNSELRPAPTLFGSRDAARDRSRKPLVNGPAGNFYRGVAGKQPRSHAERHVSRQANLRPNLPDGFHETSKHMSKKEMKKNFDRAYPTDRLRPLSLLSRASTATMERMRPGYINYKAAVDRLRQKRGSPLNAQALEDLEMQNFGRTTSATPALWAKTLPCPSKMQHDKETFSLVVLILLNLCPILLLPYALGKLDFVVSWFTYGNIKTFGKGHKQWAVRLMAVWLGVGLVGLLSFLVYWVRYRPRT